MRDIFTVFGFTLRDGLRKKAFVVTTVIVLVVIVLACALVGLFGGGQEPGGFHFLPAGLRAEKGKQGAGLRRVPAKGRISYPVADSRPQ